MEENIVENLCVVRLGKDFCRDHIKTWSLKEKIEKFTFIEFFFFKDAVKKMTKQAYTENICKNNSV